MAVVVVVTDDSAADNEVVEGEGMVIPVNVESWDEKISTQIHNITTDTHTRTVKHLTV